MYSPFKGYNVTLGGFFLVTFFVFLIFLVVAIFDLVHDVEAIFHLP